MAASLAARFMMVSFKSSSPVARQLMMDIEFGDVWLQERNESLMCNAQLVPQLAIWRVMAQVVHFSVAVDIP